MRSISRDKSQQGEPHRDEIHPAAQLKEGGGEERMEEGSSALFLPKQMLQCKYTSPVRAFRLPACSLPCLLELFTTNVLFFPPSPSKG